MSFNAVYANRFALELNSGVLDLVIDLSALSSEDLRVALSKRKLDSIEVYDDKLDTNAKNIVALFRHLNAKRVAIFLFSRWLKPVAKELTSMLQKGVVERIEFSGCGTLTNEVRLALQNAVGLKSCSFQNTQSVPKMPQHVSVEGDISLQGLSYEREETAMANITKMIFQSDFQWFFQKVRPPHCHLRDLRVYYRADVSILEKFLLSYKNLEYIYVDQKDGAWSRIASALCHSPQLKVVHARGSANDDSQAMSEMMQTCPQISEIVVSFLDVRFMDSLRTCQSLKTVMLWAGTYRTDDVLYLLRNVETYTELSLDSIYLVPFNDWRSIFNAVPRRLTSFMFSAAEDVGAEPRLKILDFLQRPALRRFQWICSSSYSEDEIHQMKEAFKKVSE